MSKYHLYNQNNKIYKFKSIKIFDYWSIHTSFKKSINFERLEFLGDRIISFILTDWIMDNFANKKESIMSNYLCSFVNYVTMSEIANFLQPYILYHPPLTQRMLCDILEAYIGAIYLDTNKNIKIVKQIILKLWKKHLNQDLVLSNYKNKTQIQLQKKHIKYEYIYEKLQDNQFKCILKDEENNEAIGIGISKKIASNNAAKRFYLLFLK